MRKIYGKQKAVKKRQPEEIDLQDFGHYRLGLASYEIDDYLRQRTGQTNIKRLRKVFNEVAGVNTCAIGPEEQTLMYRHDVERFADVILLNRSTYFD